MNKKITTTLLIILFLWGKIAGQSRVREGIHNKCDLRIKSIYPFALKGNPNFEFNMDNTLGTYKKSSETYYQLGIHETGHLDSNFYFHQENRLLYRLGLGLEYNFHKRFSVEIGFKKWKFRQDWDTNAIKQKGTYSHISFPINFRYEFFRRKFISVKAGAGYEANIGNYKNYAEIQTHCTKQDIFLFIIPYCVEEDTKFNTGNHRSKTYGLADCLTLEFSIELKVYKRFSIDFYARASETSNRNQITLNYLLPL